MYRHVGGFPAAFPGSLRAFEVLTVSLMRRDAIAALVEVDRPNPRRLFWGGCSAENPTDFKLATVRSRIEDREIGSREFIRHDR